MTTFEKLPKLIKRMQHLVTYLDSHNELVIHQHVNQSYYMQKIVELKMFHSQFDEIKTFETLTSRIDDHYNLCFLQWYKDARWLNTYQRLERTKAIL
jgi:hypothetical protein